MKRFLVILSRRELRYSNGRLVVGGVTKNNSIPLKYIDALVLMGAWSISSRLVNALLREKIPVFLLSKYGSLKGVLFSDYFSSNYRLRLLQYKAFRQRKGEIASFLLLQKAKEIELWFNLDLSTYIRKIKNTNDLNTLLGLEGFISAEMFEAFRKNLNTSFNFSNREYRPPPDEVNALLSLYYTLHYCLTLPAVLASGYDPYLSFLHTKRGRHASFCSDILEPIRPRLTYQVMEALNMHLFKKEDFNRDGKGVYLKREAFDKFLEFFERKKEKNINFLAQVLADFERELEDE